MNFIDRLLARIASSYEAMDVVAWLFLHYILVLFAIIVLSKLVVWAHARITQHQRPKRRVLHPRNRW